jgi:hypothetical protein
MNHEAQRREEHATATSEFNDGGQRRRGRGVPTPPVYGALLVLRFQHSRAL